VAGVLISIGAGHAFAQPTPQPVDARAEQRVQVWKTELNLTANQEKQVRNIMLERERQWDRDHQKLLAAALVDRPALRDAQRAHMQSFRDRLHAVLTPVQQKKALKLREMRIGRRRAHRRPGFGGGGTGPMNGGRPGPNR